MRGSSARILRAMAHSCAMEYSIFRYLSPNGIAAEPSHRTRGDARDGETDRGTPRRDKCLKRFLKIGREKEELRPVNKSPESTVAVMSCNTTTRDVRLFVPSRPLAQSRAKGRKYFTSVSCTAQPVAVCTRGTELGTDSAKKGQKWGRKSERGWESQGVGRRARQAEKERN